MMTHENKDTRLHPKKIPHGMRFAVLSSDLSAPVAVNVCWGDNNSPFIVSTERVYGVLDDTESKDFEVVFSVSDWIE